MVDFFGFGLPDVTKEVMSMHHSHDENHHLIPQVGDSMVTNLRRPIFTLLEDTGPGVHDTVVSACCQYLYQQQIGKVSRSCSMSLSAYMMVIEVPQQCGVCLLSVPLPTAGWQGKASFDVDPHLFAWQIWLQHRNKRQVPCF